MISSPNRPRIYGYTALLWSTRPYQTRLDNYKTPLYRAAWYSALCWPMKFILSICNPLLPALLRQNHLFPVSAFNNRHLLRPSQWLLAPVFVFSFSLQVKCGSQEQDWGKVWNWTDWLCKNWKPWTMWPTVCIYAGFFLLWNLIIKYWIETVYGSMHSMGVSLSRRRDENLFLCCSMPLVT